MRSARSKSRLRILANKSWIAEYKISDREVIPEPLRTGRGNFAARLRPLALWRYDAVFLDGEERWLFALSAMKRILPWVRCPTLVADIILNRPKGIPGHLKSVFARWLLKEVDLFILYFRDTTELQQLFSNSTRKDPLRTIQAQYTKERSRDARFG